MNGIQYTAIDVLYPQIKTDNNTVTVGCTLGNIVHYHRRRGMLLIHPAKSHSCLVPWKYRRVAISVNSERLRRFHYQGMMSLIYNIIYYCGVLWSVGCNVYVHKQNVCFATPGTFAYLIGLYRDVWSAAIASSRKKEYDDSIGGNV